MKIAAANYPITYHSSFEAWEKHVSAWLAKLQGKGVDLALFPEYGAIELVSLLNAELQQDAQAQVHGLQAFQIRFLQCFEKLSKSSGMILVAPSFPVLENEKVINRAYVFSPNGCEGFQDKIFMTPFEKWDWGVSAGNPLLTVFKTSKGNFGIQICYDAEFGIGSHELVQAGADIILVPSCTETLRGSTRVHVGARARALENQCYTIVSQTIGEALWTPTVDYNYGYGGAYSTPDSGFPETGVLQLGAAQEPYWLIQDFLLAPLQQVRENGGVRNFIDGAAVTHYLEGKRISVQQRSISI